MPELRKIPWIGEKVVEECLSDSVGGLRWNSVSVMHGSNARNLSV
jgi:hypothetical protein